MKASHSFFTKAIKCGILACVLLFVVSVYEYFYGIVEVIRVPVVHVEESPDRETFFTGRENKSSSVSLRKRKEESNFVTVLFWTEFHESNPLKRLIPEGIEDNPVDPSFKIINCPSVSRCKLIRDQSQLNLADGVVFHARDVFHLFKKGDPHELPPVHKHTQPWIFLQREAPIYTKLPLDRYPDIFNWTMTYRTDSDIYFPYGNIVQHLHPSSSLSSRKKIMRSKTGKVAWTVSHCGPVSKRDIVAANLGKFIDVHVYGKCGTYECNFPNEDDGCLKQLEKTYKFYLSFENSLCHQYVTEKFFNALNHSIVPVVYGYGQYEKVAPAGSYINARSFYSVKDLGDYLNFLDKNPEEYEKYFEWKNHFKVVKTDKEAWCNLCDKLLKNKIDTKRKHQWYSNLNLWFNSKVPEEDKGRRKSYVRYLSTTESVDVVGASGFIDSDSACIPPPGDLITKQ